jgi:fructose-1,6-bisphosphatase/inositol monophosphatase family enzyme
MAARRQGSRIEDFVSQFRAAALQAGAVARSLQGEVRRRSKPADGGPEGEAISAADIACQDVILLRLAERFADVALDAEEDSAAVGAFAAPSPGRPLLVLDPIDGTHNYLRGAREYAVMAAWIEHGFYQASVVHFPAYHVTYWATRGGGCWRQDDGGPAVPVSAAGPPRRLLVPPRTPRAARRRLGGLGYEVAVSRCSAVDAAVVALGEASAAVALMAPDRRRAIGFLLSVEAGGAVVFDHGPWAGEDPLGSGRSLEAHAVAATGEHAARLLAALE